MQQEVKCAKRDILFIPWEFSKSNKQGFSVHSTFHRPLSLQNGKCSTANTVNTKRAAIVVGCWSICLYVKGPVKCLGRHTA